MKKIITGDQLYIQFEDTPEDRKLWLQTRLDYITATEAGILMGVGYNKAANSLLISKQQVDEIPDNIYMKNGREVEESILLKAAKLIGSNLTSQQGFYANLKSKISVTPDGILEDGTLVEAKGSHIRNFEKWSKYPPLYYIMQVQTQMYVLKKQKAYLEAHFFYDWDTRDYLLSATRTYEIKYCPALIEILLDKVDQFWYAFKEGGSLVVTGEEKRQHQELLEESCNLFFAEKLMDKIQIEPRQDFIIKQTCFKAAAKMTQGLPTTAVEELANLIYYNVVDKICQEKQQGDKNFIIQLGAMINGYVESGRQESVNDMKKFVLAGLDFVRK